MTASRAASERGLTLVEVVVAMFVGLLGALGIAQLISAAERNSYRVEQSQVIATMLQKELERIKDLPYAEVALTSVPQRVNDPRNPASRVTGRSFALNPEGGDKRPLVVNGDTLSKGGVVFGGVVDPRPTPFTAGDVDGEIHRFVVWINDPSCPDSLCPGAQDLKRIIVAATLDDGPTGARRYQEVHTDVADPDAVPVENALPPGTGEEGTYATFWLTDTPCSFDSRQPLIGDHRAHNTLGVCSSGPAFGDGPGAPDLLAAQPPPLDAGQAIHDYATDLEPALGPDKDKGLQLRRSGCVFGVSQDDPQHRAHRWVTPKVPAGSELKLAGEATLALWTRTVDATSGPGEICVVLFVRRPLEGGGHEDILFENATGGGEAFVHGQGQWPSDWAEIAVSMEFEHSRPSLGPGERLGVAISGARSATEPGLEFMYDNPSFDTRLVLKTTGEIPEF
jgi:hypothetical protein